MLSSQPYNPLVVGVSTFPQPENLAEVYLDLMKKILTRALVAHGMERHTIHSRSAKSKLVASLNQRLAQARLELVRLLPSTPDDYLESGHEATNRVEDAESMLGTRQFDRMQRCIVDVLEKQVPGDLLEAGVWRGGMTIFMRAVLKAYACRDRKVWVVDSFAGLPPIDGQKESFDWKLGDMAVSLETVRGNFARYSLLDEQVEFLKGYFNESLPKSSIGPLAILRIDADLYTSTLDALEHLYPRLSPGGYAVFDDYQNLPDCQRAIDEYRKKHGITEEIHKIDTRAVYWQRSH
ncbi:TylF/MycF/NovP-related O-methyltransferase [Bryobacter aggregatus]|uniref:TylF/MycF/NovP-related O-methyltransferase n=1 Tax=Bryobacter aggregatus TaxID=360054 RepID=UPI002351CD3B|nr:TylF/MycF/NovP-related O-methyltransferase [Bryobacter aggregatus]